MFKEQYKWSGKGIRAIYEVLAFPKNYYAEQE